MAEYKSRAVLAKENEQLAAEVEALRTKVAELEAAPAADAGGDELEAHKNALSAAQKTIADLQEELESVHRRNAELESVLEQIEEARKQGIIPGQDQAEEVEHPVVAEVIRLLKSFSKTGYIQTFNEAEARLRTIRLSWQR